MSVLIFWKGNNYYKDMKYSGKSYVFNQNNELILDIKDGQHTWIFTRRRDKTYVLALDLAAIGNQVNQPNMSGYSYGKYQVKGDKKNSRYFNVEQGKDIEMLIRSLSFKPQAAILGQSFRGRNGVRKLTDYDDEKLIAFASGLPTI